jgi:putative Mn2+ efflux pump MntP
VLWLWALLVAVVSNLDNLAAGFAYGLRNTKIGTGSNVVIAAVTMAGTAAAMTSGRELSRLLAPSFASQIGGLIILIIGVKTVAMGLQAVRRPPGAAVAGLSSTQVRSGNNRLSLRQAAVLAVALSLNNVGSGIGAGIARVSPLATTLLAGVISLVCVGGGARLGALLGRPVMGRQASLVAGVVLVGVGGAMLAGAG